MSKIHAYQQIEYSDCGPTCIRIICRYFGCNVSATYLRKHMDTNRLGTTIGELKKTLQELGFETAIVKVSDAQSARCRRLH